MTTTHWAIQLSKNYFHYNITLTRTLTRTEWLKINLPNARNLKPYHVNTSVMAVVNFIAANNWIWSSSNLDARQIILINVILFDKTPSFTKNINTTLRAIIYFIFTYCRIGMRRYPYASKCIIIYTIFQKLTTPLNFKHYIFIHFMQRKKWWWRALFSMNFLSSLKTDI